MIHGDFAQYNEDQTGDPFHLENKKLLKVSLQYGPVMAKAGSMVAYQGEAAFKNLGSGGLSKMIKKAVTAEGVVAMEVTGNGQVFLANQGMDIQVMYLENDAVFCNGASVLAYSASKGGLLQLMRHLSTLLAPAVRVNAISPGGIERGQPEAFRRNYAARTPLKRMGTEEDMKGAVAYLASDLSAYVTGQNLVVDGGWTAW